MEHLHRIWTFVVALGLLLVPGCSRMVTGSASAAAPAASGPTPTAAAAVGGAPSSAARARGPTLQSDVLADECLLDAGQFGALVGRRVRVEQSVVRRDDGTRGTSCYAGAVDGPSAPLAALNVYRVRSGTPAEFVGAAGGRPIEGAGGAATLLETAAGPTLQVAGKSFLVTLVVQGRSPPDEAWRTAARAALARLPS